MGSKNSRQILLADDEVDFLSICSIMLRREGFHVHSVASGREVIPAIKSNGPAVVILDVRIGDMDGRDICQEIKKDPIINGVKVILNSAYTDIRESYKLYQADDFILKPYQIEHLVERINLVLG